MVILLSNKWTFTFFQIYAPTTLAPARDLWTLRYTTSLDNGSIVVCNFNYLEKFFQYHFASFCWKGFGQSITCICIFKELELFLPLFYGIKRTLWSLQLLTLLLALGLLVQMLISKWYVWLSFWFEPGIISYRISGFVKIWC